MIILKSKREIEIMRQAGRIVAECHALLAETIRPGITTKKLDEMVERHIVKSGAIPSFKGHHGFPASICVAINDVVCHGFPTDLPLQGGDIVTLDIGALFQGYHGDSAWTYGVGEITKEARKLMEIGRQSLFIGIEQAIKGNHLGAIGFSIQRFIESEGYNVVRDFCGHGVGQELWEEPREVLHYGNNPKEGIKLKAGMTLAIEPIITAGKYYTTIDNDGWTARTADGSLSVQYEHSIVITENGPEILTALPGA